MIHNVMDFGALGNGSHDDQPNIMDAIEAAEAAGGGIVYFPKGIYAIRATVRVKGNGVILQGDGRNSVILHKVYVDEEEGTREPFIPVWFEKDLDANRNPGELRNVGIRDLTIQFEDAGPDSAGAVTLNACVDFFCERVTVLGDGNGMKLPQRGAEPVGRELGSITNGIVTGYTTRDGVISGCVIDGVSKPGIYLAGAENVTVVACVSKNIKCTQPGLGSAPGFSVGRNRNVSFIDCHAHDCQGNGFQISSIGSFTATIQGGPGDPTPTPTSFRYKEDQNRLLGTNLARLLAVWNPTTTRYEVLDVASVTNVNNLFWDVVLNTAPSVTLAAGVALRVNYQPYRNVTIVGGSAARNGTNGVGFGTNLVGAVGRDVLVCGVACNNNTGAGINVTSAEDVVIQNCILHNNQTGLVVSDIGPGQGAENQTGRVLVGGCAVYDNTSGDVMVRSANDVTIENSKLYRSPGAAQATGLIIRDYTVITTNKKATNVKLRDLEFDGYTAPNPIFHTLGDQAAVESGLYSLRLPGAPEGVHYAPAGSEYTDRTTGLKYVKSSGFLKTGWSRVLTAGQDVDAPGRAVVRTGGVAVTENATTATAASYAVPDDTVAHVAAVVVARNRSTGDSAVFRRTVGVKRHDSGPATLVGAVQTFGSDGEDAAASAWDVTLDTSGNDVRVRVTGAASTNVSWFAHLEVDTHTPPPLP
ncbi:uncharacterized protein SOCE26_040730 [Sorangium cellulosum]|uniref:Rhamnogalacturonase A/B/Epimerase-like pectate lyase domain-containing protein n=1 Tax=Sorangium cellulosum TaxID=56 RepID=A0A2L0ETL9_SORCE|nr:right-handed parallel beta-helix repeat-containing protein [Sorangium cellulosum]AUX42640.1 uncharacterized protein SOCE26_040730 [Sorangium cellulosum]